MGNDVISAYMRHCSGKKHSQRGAGRQTPAPHRTPEAGGGYIYGDLCVKFFTPRPCNGYICMVTVTHEMHGMP